MWDRTPSTTAPLAGTPKKPMRRCLSIGSGGCHILQRNRRPAYSDGPGAKGRGCQGRPCADRGRGGGSLIKQTEDAITTAGGWGDSATLRVQLEDMKMEFHARTFCGEDET